MDGTVEADLPDERRTRPGDVVRVGVAIVLALAIGTALVWLAIAVLSDEHRDPLYRQTYEDGRAIGTTSGWLDDGSKIGAVTFYDEDGVVCTIYGPPGERRDDLHCVPDTGEEVDAINWEVDPERGVVLTVMVVDGRAPDVEFQFDGAVPGHATGRFPIAKPAVVVVYLGPPWDGLDVDTGSSG